MGKIFSLASIAPARELFEDSDGTKYSFALPSDFDLIVDATRYRINVEMDEIEAQRQLDPGNEEHAKAWISKLQDLVRLHIRDFPVERSRFLTQHECLEILRWWKQNLDPTKAEAAAE